MVWLHILAQTPEIAVTSLDLDRIASAVMSRLQGRPVAMLAEAAQAPLAFLDGGGFGEEQAPFTLDGDVAIVSISGPTLQEAFTLCGFTIADGYDAIGERSRAAFASDKVAAVQVHMNSPGGVCVGGHELMLDWRAWAEESGKPLDVWVNGAAYSMAMWLSAGAQEIFLPPSAGVGSIGVVQTALNKHGALAEAGLIPIIAADPAEKVFAHGADLLPIQPQQMDRMGREVSAMMDLFAQAVSEARGLTPEQIRGLKAQTFMGQAAVDARLADAVLGKRAAIERTRSKIRRKAYSMATQNGGQPQHGAALIRLLGLDPAETYTAEQIEKAATARCGLADLGAHVLKETGAGNETDAREIFEIYRQAHSALPTAQNELRIRETQLAVSTGRLLPKDAYAPEATDREYPALPALHPEIAGRGIAVLRARFAQMSAAPETLRKGEPRKTTIARRITDAERDGAKKAGMSEAEYIAHLAKFDNASAAPDEENDE